MNSADVTIVSLYRCTAAERFTVQFHSRYIQCRTHNALCIGITSKGSFKLQQIFVRKTIHMQVLVTNTVWQQLGNQQ